MSKRLLEKGEQSSRELIARSFNSMMDLRRIKGLFKLRWQL